MNREQLKKLVIEQLDEISDGLEENSKIEGLEKRVINAALKGTHDPAAIGALTKMSKQGQYNMARLKKKIKDAKARSTVKEMGCPSDMPKQDHDHEGKMHRSSLFKMAKYSVELLDMIQDADDLPEWVESKITKAADYLEKAFKSISYEKGPGRGKL